MKRLSAHHVRQSALIILPSVIPFPSTKIRRAAQKHPAVRKRRTGEELVRRVSLRPSSLNSRPASTATSIAFRAEHEQLVAHDGRRRLHFHLQILLPNFFPSFASKHASMPPLVTVKTSSPLLTGLVMSGMLSSAVHATCDLVTSPAPSGRRATSLLDGLTTRPVRPQKRRRRDFALQQLRAPQFVAVGERMSSSRTAARA